MSNGTKNVVHGYKVFNPDWTCDPFFNKKQYTCPGKFEEEGTIAVCGHGMHFCQSAIDCFRYYDFSPDNKVAEVIAYDNVLTDGNKSCTNKLEIVRELSWEEVLRLVNTGKDCTGLGNTGDDNTGHRNTGDWNTGCWNTGNRNAGYRNSGDYNTGDGNTGDGNTGDQNTGSRNAGYRNSGDYNTGDGNTGDGNTGCRNTGYCNAGDRNTGHYNVGTANSGFWNTGDRNTGDFNMSSGNAGCFNTEEQTIILFNKPSNMTRKDWECSGAKRILLGIPKVNRTKWISTSDMTDEEKAANPTYETTGGFLKEIDESMDRQEWWNELPEEDKATIKAIPNFDADIFYKCTGIRVE